MNQTGDARDGVGYLVVFHVSLENNLQGSKDGNELAALQVDTLDFSISDDIGSAGVVGDERNFTKVVTLGVVLGQSTSWEAGCGAACAICFALYSNELGFDIKRHEIIEE